MGATKRAGVAAVALPTGSGKAHAVQGGLASSASPVSSSGEQRSCLTSQLRKTKICVYHLKGACQYGNNCAFAHSCTELQSIPDLRKTRLCQAFEQTGGCNNKDCSFAHGEEELRSTNLFYKKTLCIWNQKGKCRNGDQCRFAHGTSELRTSQGGHGGQGNHGNTQASGKQSAAKGGGGNGAKMLKEPMKVLAAGCLPMSQPAALPATLPVEASELHQSMLGGVPAPGMPFIPDAYSGLKDGTLPGALEAASAWWQWPLSYGAVPQDIASDLERIREDVVSLTQKCNEIQMQMVSPTLAGAYLKGAAADPGTAAAYLKAAPGLEVEPAGAGEELFPTYWA